MLKIIFAKKILMDGSKNTIFMNKININSIKSDFKTLLQRNIKAKKIITMYDKNWI